MRAVSRQVRSFLEWFGELALFNVKLARAAFTAPFHGQELLKQMFEFGNRSLPLVLVASASTGVVLSLQMRESLTRFGAKAFLPVLIVLAMIKESGP